MDQLVQLVAEKTGIDTDKAKEAVDAVLAFLKEKLPEPVAGQIDSLFSGASGGDLVDKGKDMLGGLFGDT
jgi:hypothetical protein